MANYRIETGTKDLLAELKDGIATLTLTRPDSKNAMTDEMNHALAAMLAQFECDSKVRCIVLTGAGKAFCAGGDVKNMVAEGDHGSPETLDEEIHQLRTLQRATTGKLFKMPKPTMAVLPGSAAGAGFSLALACDLRIMSTNAFLVTSFARVGFPGDNGGTYFLTQLVGTAKARELYFLSDRIGAEEALSLGLTNWVVEPEELEIKTKEIASRLASGPPVAYRYMKENINRALAGNIDDCMDLEATHMVHSGLTEDHKEGARAFVEKREPVFKGR
jgi:2-(1,2-epoxy-1,2-dihydrophenyl)acetyl-CoA isomerase